MYTRFKELCDQKGVTPYRVAKDTGIGRSTFTDWKKGRTPRADKLKKLADYFVVVNSILSRSQQLREINHELNHIKNGDYSSELPADSIEAKTPSG